MILSKDSLPKVCRTQFYSAGKMQKEKNLLLRVNHQRQEIKLKFLSLSLGGWRIYRKEAGQSCVLIGREIRHSFVLSMEGHDASTWVCFFFVGHLCSCYVIQGKLRA
jgi:hypothetical protein